MCKKLRSNYKNSSLLHLPDEGTYVFISALPVVSSCIDNCFLIEHTHAHAQAHTHTWANKQK